MADPITDIASSAISAVGGLIHSAFPSMGTAQPASAGSQSSAPAKQAEDTANSALQSFGVKPAFK